VNGLAGVRTGGPHGGGRWPAPELVVFDCDGVLIDSEKIAVKVDARVFAELGWPLSEAEIVERFVGRGHVDA
jgi:beta-phosphoglucomutase-like phosphatase (HAD superfamily)